jgi:hypothetical protein
MQMSCIQSFFPIEMALVHEISCIYAKDFVIGAAAPLIRAVDKDRDFQKDVSTKPTPLVGTMSKVNPQLLAGDIP